MHLHVTAFPEDSVSRVQVMGRGICTKIDVVDKSAIVLCLS